MNVPEKKPVPMRTLLAANALVLAGLLSVVVCGLEVYYRYFYDSTDLLGLTRISARWFERHYQYNKLEIRDNIEYMSTVAPGRKRVTFLGDSFTAGHGVADVDKRFVNLMRERTAGRLELHAAARNGFDTGQEVGALRLLADLGYETDVVVLVYVLNDVSDLIPAWQAHLARIYREQADEPFLVRHSYFINKLYYQLKATRDPGVANYFTSIRAAYDGPIWAQQQSRLAGLAEYCRFRNIRLLVVTFPFLQALGPDYAYAGIHRRLDRFWSELGVPHLDLLPVFASYAPEQVVVGKYDAHPNERAHAVAADAIGEFIDKQVN